MVDPTSVTIKDLLETFKQLGDPVQRRTLFIRNNEAYLVDDIDIVLSQLKPNAPVPDAEPFRINWSGIGYTMPITAGFGIVSTEIDHRWYEAFRRASKLNCGKPRGKRNKRALALLHRQPRPREGFAV